MKYLLTLFFSCSIFLGLNPLLALEANTEQSTLETKLIDFEWFLNRDDEITLSLTVSEQLVIPKQSKSKIVNNTLICELVLEPIEKDCIVLSDGSIVEKVNLIVLLENLEEQDAIKYTIQKKTSYHQINDESIIRTTRTSSLSGVISNAAIDLNGEISVAIFDDKPNLIEMTFITVSQ